MFLSFHIVRVFVYVWKTEIFRWVEFHLRIKSLPRLGYLELAINEAWLPRINHRFSSCFDVAFLWGVFANFQLNLSFFKWWLRKGEPFLSYVFLRGVGIIWDQFVWGKKACHWLLPKLEQTVLDHNSRHFFTFREGNIAYTF